MPRWARFLSCSLTASILLLVGLAVTAWLWEGGPDYWAALFDFVATPEFWALTRLVAAGGALLVIAGRLLANLYGWPSGVAGLASGVLIPGCYGSFLLATHAPAWGGWAGALQRATPDLLVLAAPFAFASLFASWLWDRLD